MRPDPHKQAASRKYHNKVKARGGAVDSASSRGGKGGSAGGAVATATSTTIATGTGNGGVRGGRGSHRGQHSTRGGYRGHRDSQEQEGEEDDDNDGPRKSYARRKITSNADRYIEKDDEVAEAEELDQGIDRQTIAFREMLKDSDQKKTFDPAAYFRFKSEREVDGQDPLEDSQQTRQLLGVRLDDIEKALMTLSIKDRLNLTEADALALDKDVVGKVSFSTGKPIVPKLVRGQAASDILVKPSSQGPLAALTPSSPSNFYSNVTSSSTTGTASRQKMQASMDADLDELLDMAVSDEPILVRLPTGRPVHRSPSKASTASAIATTTTAASAGSSSSAGTSKTLASAPSAPRAKGLPPLLKTKGPPTQPAASKDEEWLDSVLGM